MTPRYSQHQLNQHQDNSRRHTCSMRPFRRAVSGRLLCCAMMGISIVTLLSDKTNAQTARTVGFRQRAFAIVHATVVPRPGEILKNADVLIRDGVIVGIGPALKIPTDTEAIDATGMFVYAGFIDAGTADLIDANRRPKPVAGRKVDFTRYVLAATRPDNRHSFTPEFHAADALKSDTATPESFRK